MDMMELRRMVMAQMASGVDISPWKIKKITAPSNMTKCSDIRNWFMPEIPDSSVVAMIALDDFDESNFVQNQFLLAFTINKEINQMSFLRKRTGFTPPYQTRNLSSDTEDAIVTQGDTFTIFYQ